MNERQEDMSLFRFRNMKKCRWDTYHEMFVDFHIFVGFGEEFSWVVLHSCQQMIRDLVVNFSDILNTWNSPLGASTSNNFHYFNENLKIRDRFTEHIRMMLVSFIIEPSEDYENGLQNLPAISSKLNLRFFVFKSDSFY